MKLGSGDADNFVIGSDQVDKIMLGSVSVWENYDLTVGLTNHWQLFNDGNDMTGDLNFVSTGAPSFTGIALNCDGSESDYLEITSDGFPALRTVPHIISVWVKFNDTSSTSILVNNYSKTSGNGNSYNSGSRIILENAKIKSQNVVKNNESTTDSNGFVDDSYTVTTTMKNAVENGVWYHFLSNHMKYGVELYVNGVFESSVSSTQEIGYGATSGKSFSPGILSYTNGSVFFHMNGFISNIRRYDADSIENIAELASAIYNSEKSFYL